jgi:16S rRNA processing protein RimM
MAAEARICLGQIGAAHGVRGEVRLRSFTADPQAITAYGPLETEDGRVLEIETLRPAKDHFVAQLAGVSDRDAAEKLTNLKLYVPRVRLPELNAASEFYHADLIGLVVVDRTGKNVGVVIAVPNYGAGDLIEVKPQAGGKTLLIPFDSANVPVVDVAAGKIVIDPADGILGPEAD